MRRHIYTGAMGGAYGTLTNNIFLIAFGNVLGVTVFQWGLLGAITTFALAFQLVSAHWAAWLGHRRLLWWAAEGFSRLVKAVGLVAAFMLYQQGNLPAAAFCLVFWLCLAGVFAALAQPVWYSWLVDIIPERIHGRFMGRRDVWVALLVVALAVPAGWATDVYNGDVQTAVLAAIFMVGILLGIVDVCMHRVIPEPPMTPDRTTTFRDRILTPLQDRDFRPWLVFAACWNFAMFLGGTLANVYFIENLGLRDNFLGGSAVLIAVPLVAVVFTSRWTGILVDRMGVKQMLILSHFFFTILPIFWIVATPETALFWLTVSATLGGAAGSPAVNAANKLVSRTPAPQFRAMYLAMSTCVGSLAGGLGALLGGVFLTSLGNTHWTLGGWDFVPYHLLFMASLVLRLAAWGLIFRVKQPAFDRPVAEVVPEPVPVPVFIPAPEAIPERAA